MELADFPGNSQKKKKSDFECKITTAVIVPRVAEDERLNFVVEIQKLKFLMAEIAQCRLQPEEIQLFHISHEQLQ